jgi:beta-xylosidase
VLKSNKSWKCPGHGAVLQTPSGHWWLLYNGYRARGSPHRGREMLLDLVRWTRDGWPLIIPGSHPLNEEYSVPTGGGVEAAPARGF